MVLVKQWESVLELLATVPIANQMTELNAASKKLDDLTPNIKAIVGDEMKGYMINDDAGIESHSQVKLVKMLNSNEHLHYVVLAKGLTFGLTT